MTKHKLPPTEVGDTIQFKKQIRGKRLERIRKVLELTNQGWTEEEIADLFGVTPRLIRYDLKEGPEYYRTLSKAVDQGETLGQEIDSYKQAMKLEWRNYHLCTNPLVRAAVMRNIISLKEKYVKFLQSAGLLDKVPEQINLGKAPPDLSDFTKEELELAVSIGMKLGGMEDDDEKSSGPE